MDPTSGRVKLLAQIEIHDARKIPANAKAPTTMKRAYIQSLDGSIAVESWKAVGSAVTSKAPLIKIVVVVDPAEADELAKAWSSVLDPKVLRVVRSTLTTVEILAASANKGVAIARSIGPSLTMSDVVAFGDGDNDAEMLASAGLGIAMGNCLEGACRAALVRTGSNDTDSIARVLLRVAIGPRCAHLPDSSALNRVAPGHS